MPNITGVAYPVSASWVWNNVLHDKDVLVAFLTRTSSWPFSQGYPCGLSNEDIFKPSLIQGRPRGLPHEDVLVGFLTRTSSSPFSRGRPRGLLHEDVLVATARGRIQ